MHAVQYLLLVDLIANVRRFTGAFQLSQRVCTFLYRVFVIEPRTLASAMRLVEVQCTNV